MGEFTITKWRCDRCGCVMDKKPGPYGEAGTFTLRADSDFATCGDSLSWAELCPACNGYVGRLISGLRKEVQESTS